MVPVFDSFNPIPSKDEISGLCPIAGITVSTSILNSEPFIGIGLALPLSSGFPSFILMHSIPTTLPFFPIILTGWTRKFISMPSFNVSSISDSCAGISFLVLLYKIKALLPKRWATLTASIATSPPPMTATFLPIFAFLPRLTYLRNSTPGITPFKSSPLMASFFEA